MSYFDLPVFFRGKRNYIQGSMILSLAAEKLIAEGIIQDIESAKLIKAKFNQITDKGVKLLVADQHDKKDDIILGEASFSENSNSLKVYFIEDTQNTPPQEEDRSSLIQNFTITEELNGTCVFTIEPTLDDKLASIVEVVKTLHSDLSNDVYDIWFTGFSGANFPLNSQNISTSGKITVKNVMKKKTPDFIQTLFRITIDEPESGMSSSFMLTFAYKMS